MDTVQGRPRTAPKDTDNCKDWAKRQRHCQHQLEEKIGNQQCKNSLKHKKMVIPEPSCHTIGRVDNPNPDEADKNYFKSNFLTMMDTFNEEMKSSLKETEDRTNKNWKNSINLLNKPKKIRK